MLPAHTRRSAHQAKRKKTFFACIIAHRRGGDDTPVGVITLSVSPVSDGTPYRRGHIPDMFVEADMRGKGLGKILMEYGISWLEHHGARSISLDVWAGNEDKISFYERFGFSVLDQEPPPSGAALAGPRRGGMVVPNLCNKKYRKII